MAKPKRRKTTPVAPPRATELSLVAAYERPWKTDAAEIAVIDASDWHPTSIDFRAVASTPNHTIKNGKMVPAKATEIQNMGSLSRFVGAVQKYANGNHRPDHSIARLNLFSHGTPGLLSLAGEVKPNGDCELGLSNPSDHVNDRGIDLSTLEWLNETDLGRAHRDIVRGKLTADAEIWLFLCHAGAGGVAAVLGQELANTFGAVVAGFDDEIMIWPDYDSKQIGCLSADGFSRYLLGKEERESMRKLSVGCVAGRNLTSIGRGKEQLGRGYFCHEKAPDVLAGRHMVAQPARVVRKTPKPTE